MFNRYETSNNFQRLIINLEKQAEEEVDVDVPAGWAIKDLICTLLALKYWKKTIKDSYASFVTIKPLEGIASVTTAYLLKMKNPKRKCKC